ncbi:toxin glutamine deamidase domain-containing protein [Micromonospora sp. RHAY321]|uniref:toxin glutamine deamidase domain-containing protein n=1 Tax=Micromonospora sp. RHAY321 TaxID=2944807 RepID=UPI00207C5299|nr:toxin glutamine deamidase domain-containing protein [Micromonospora sp. RHAY321]MCO1598671.1 toxin glutamine deamidase domain-containing protein [Micromonospora sp. RHAY321]
MSVLPSPIPHPLDYAPWDVPGWVYEALDWAVGVQWPEGNERAVWDVADQWYSVAAVLAGPHADAAAAAAEVRSGYGGVGPVDAAFEAAWRGLAEGDDAPLPVLLAVTADLGRLVEECGCDIEGAKLEVWIELGILVVELLAVAVAAVLTAGAASPAAGAAITATRLLIQQIFKRLMGQLASKSLRHGLKEAGERAAKEVARGGVRGFAKRATREGLEEAAEEAGVTLATQAYQNSTGRAHGVDLADLGASAVGGLAGGAVAPLAGLGRHATGRAARVGEHLGREMTGEVLAENAASLATGRGLTSVEDAARAAASGATGSATGQADHALHARLDAQANALAGASLAGPSLAPVDFSAPVPAAPVAAASSASLAPALASPQDVATVAASQAAVSEADVSSSVVIDQLSTQAGATVSYEAGLTAPAVSDLNGSSASTIVGSPTVDDGPSRSVTPAETAAPSPDQLGPPTADGPSAAPPIAADPTLSSVAAPVAGTPDQTGGTATSVAHPSHASTASALASGGNGPSAWYPWAGTTSTPTTSTGATPTATAGAAPPVMSTGPLAASHLPIREAPALARVPAHPARGRASVPADVAAPAELDIESSDWYAALWRAEAEAAERRLYQGYYESRRTEFENSRRQAEASRLRALAAEHDRRAAEYANYAWQLRHTGHPRWADGWQRTANDEMRAYAEFRDLADAVLAGARAPSVVDIGDAAFRQANKDVGALALGAVESVGRSRLTGDDVPPPIDDSRPYGQPGGLRPPLALHQVDVERQMPREPDGSIVRTADPRRGGWFRLLNDGGPEADATRGINCLDCTLSLFETWVHGRPRVSAPRTFDGYLDGDIRRPIRGEAGGPGRVEDATGGRFQQLLSPPTGQPSDPAQTRRTADRGYANLHDQLLLGGHGSYAFLITEWPNGGSHAWVALNQNGTVLYVDPQTGLVRDRPLYPHVVGIDALVLDGNGRPMPLGGLPRGRFSERPDLPEHPPALDEGGHGDPYINRMYLLLDGPGSAEHSITPNDDAAVVSGHDQLALELAQLTPSEWAVLTSCHDRALAAADRIESSLTQVGQRVSDALGLSDPIRLRDRGSRVKGLQSLARKYVDETRATPIEPTEFIASVNDALRFCFEMPSGERYRKAVESVLDGLIETGFSVLDSGCKNFWREGNRFYGFNCTLRSSDGMLLELQLHTSGSRKAWLATHEDYEVVRRASNSPEGRVGALLRMLIANREYGLPDCLPTGLESRFPGKDATFAKWISRNIHAWREYRAWLDRQGMSFQQVVQELGLGLRDFPVATQVARELEQEIVELLRDLPER